MTRLRRIATHERIFFVTTNLERHIEQLSPSERACILDILAAEHRKGSFYLFGYVVMPDHLHALMRPVNHDLPRIMRDLKSATGFRLTQSRAANRAANRVAHLFRGEASAHNIDNVAHLFRGEASPDNVDNVAHLLRAEAFPANVVHVSRPDAFNPPPVRRLKSAGAFWQRRYFDYIIRRVRDFWNKLDYIHENPVKAGLAKRPEDWPWSSYAAYTKCGQPPIPIDPIELPVDENTLLWPSPWAK